MTATPIVKSVYDSIRPRIRSGDLLAWRHESWGSWKDLKVQLVRMATRSTYSHVAVAWCVGGRVLVIEAVQPVVRIFPLSRLLPCYWWPMEAPWAPETEQLALSKLGEPYSEHQAVMAFLRKLPVGADAWWECAELAISVLRKDGIDLGPIAVPEDVVLKAQEGGREMRYLTA